MGKEAKYIVRLTDEERHTLQQLVAGPRVARAKALRARLLLKTDVDGPNWPDRQIADAFAVGMSTLHRLRQRCVEDGLEAALTRPSPVRTKPRKLDGAQEARLVALACSQAPEGRVSWTLRLLAEKLVELEIVETICRETVRQTLKKTISSPG
jgi:transposase